MKLVHVRPGVTYRVRLMEQGWRSLLGDLGLYEGAVVSVLSAMPFRGPLILDLGGSRVALDRSLAGTIEVQAVQEN